MRNWSEKSVQSPESEGNNDDAKKVEGEFTDPLSEDECDASIPQCAPNLSMDEYRQLMEEFEQILRS